MSMSIAIIGGGQAAQSFAAKMRSLDPNCKLSIFSDEAAFPYQRPPLSKKYATGEMSAEQLLLRPSDWYADNDVECHLKSRVSEIDCANHTLTLEDGGIKTWDKLVLTTGSRARVLPESIGGKLPGVYVLRNLQDADQLAGLLIPGKKVTIVGGGYIGLEAAAVCTTLGLEVVLIEAAERILQRVACKETSDWFRTLHETHGVRIYEDTALDHLAGGDGKAVHAVLGNGDTIECDFALVGIGIIPNDDLAHSCGLQTDNGIVVNEFCQTSNPDVYAAGDCAVFKYRGADIRLESVQNAIDQAECAAINLAGNTKPYEPHPWFWSDQYDVKLQIAGLNQGYDSVVVRKGDREGAISHLYFEGEALLAVDAMNDPRTYMVCKKMLEAGKNITPEQARDPTLELKSLM